MERLTKKAIGCFEYDLKNFNHIPGEFGTYDAFFYYSMAVRKLGKYEETNLEPEEIIHLNDFEHSQCDKLLTERDTLKKALEKYRKVEQWLDDMSNPLEPLKVSAALQSEIMKYNYRKEHKPKSISELDGTIISALLFIQQAQETGHEK